MLGIHHDAELGEVEAVVAVAVVLPEACLHVGCAQPAVQGESVQFVPTDLGLYQGI